MQIHPWIEYPLALEGDTVALQALEQHHIPELLELAQDQRIWAFYAIDGSDPEKMTHSLQTAIRERAAGSQYPFVIVHKARRCIIGSTRFLELQPAHRKLEIGWTWLHPGYWASGVNTECKLLLLTYCFETLRAARVQLKTDERNIRSRKAIEKIGGQLEGILRNDMIRDDLTHRHSAYYSIIDQEWPAAKARLLARLKTL